MKRITVGLGVTIIVCTLWSCSKHGGNPGPDLASTLVGFYNGTLVNKGTGGLPGQQYYNLTGAQVQVTEVDDSTIQVSGGAISFTAGVSIVDSIFILNNPELGGGTFNPNSKTLQISTMQTIGGGVPGCPVVYRSFQGTKQ